ncbi:uncharacterized protein LOC127264199 [Andrographis paniculata]|uniref:uncharacterized protein LOC127264199 n=1 Tax=Andrographis paniculata TaxID=175694 RepID=UPI0021E6F80E|nr:uncharacterized protein LOC127264199 [Andrographis paniculata]
MIPMLSKPFSPPPRVFSNLRTHFFNCTTILRSAKPMGSEKLGLIQTRKQAIFRLANVSGFKTELLEISCHNPALHIVFVPGNPGVVSFYADFLDWLFEFLGGTASITAVGHISHSGKDSESGRLFSLQEQIDHKISFVDNELKDVDVPVVLIGHSIGAHICLEMFRRSQEKVAYCICLYPFLAVDRTSSTQSLIRKIAASSALCAALSTIGASLRILPTSILKFLVKNSIGKSWSSSAVEVLCSHVLQYHTMRNMLYMAMTEFEKLPENPDWDLIRWKRNRIAFLFGADDHWGPLHLYEEMCRKVPDASAEVEREGHTHAFSCSEAGSVWVARHVAGIIKKDNGRNLSSESKL